MHKKITITMEHELYKKLFSLIRKGKVSSFIEEAVKEKLEKEQYVDPIETGYMEMAKDEKREESALEWSEFGLDETLKKEDFSTWK